MLLRLGYSRDSRATESLLALLQDETTPDRMQRDAIIVLGHVGGKRAGSALLAAVAAGMERQIAEEVF